jgi:hypothetical protein
MAMLLQSLAELQLWPTQTTPSARHTLLGPVRDYHPANQGRRKNLRRPCEPRLAG